MGNADITILHDDSVKKKASDLIFRAEIFTVRYLAVDTSSVKISARFNVQSRK